MRTAFRSAALAATAFLLAACSDPPKQLVELQRDHERCLTSEQNDAGEVRYTDYQACMTTRGWSDPDLTERG
jgi:hypothetical protein